MGGNILVGDYSIGGGSGIGSSSNNNSFDYTSGDSGFAPVKIATPPTVYKPEYIKRPLWGPASGQRLTIGQAMLWYKFGGGTRMDIDINSIDLSKVRMSDFNSRGIATVRLDGKHFSNLDDALVHGTITLQRIGNTNQARVALNSDPTTPKLNGKPAGMYDFEMRSWSNPGNLLVRNPVTFMGGIFNGLLPIGGTLIYVEGTPFPIYYYGTTTIQR